MYVSRPSVIQSHPLTGLVRSLRRLILALILALGSTPPVLVGAGGIHTVYYVTTTADDGPGSLREAIGLANSVPGYDDISIAISGQVNLASLLPTITDTLTLDVPLAFQPFIIDGQDLYPGLRISNVPVTINGLIVQNARTFGNLPGAGIASDGDLTLNSVTVRDSTGGGNGGGVSAAGTLVVSGGLFEHNAADVGGGLYAGVTLLLTDTQIISNTASGAGGAYAGQAAYLSGGRFERNAASSSSGGLATHDTLMITGTEFISNTTAGTAGAVFADGAGPFVLTNALFTGNQSAGAGGMYVSSSFTTTLTNSNFVDNQGGSLSGGLRANRVVVSGSLFERNSATSGSGGLSANVAVITHTTFISNTGGNGLYAGGGLGTQQATIADSWFINNHGFYGGGAAAWDGALAVTSSVFLGNSAQGRGGGLVHGGSDGLVVNTLFAGNTAPGGGAALWLGGTGTDSLKHVTIASATPVTTSAITTTKEIALFQNVIIANHAVGVAVGAGFVVINNALFYATAQPTLGPIASETERATGDPKFANPAAGDFHLLAGSAAIDSGLDAGIAVDYDGHARPALLDYDIGFDEFTFRRLLLPVVRR